MKRKTKLVNSLPDEPGNYEILIGQWEIGQDVYGVSFEYFWNVSKKKYVKRASKPEYYGKLIEKSLIGKLSKKGAVILYLKGKAAKWVVNDTYCRIVKVGYGNTVCRIFATEEDANTFVEEYNKVNCC